MEENQTKIEFVDYIIDKKDWKEFKQDATQDELEILAIGSRYQIRAGSFIVKTLIAVLGMILSVVLGIVIANSAAMVGIVILVGGFLFFSLMASKLCGYEATHDRCYKLLDKEHKAHLDTILPKQKGFAGVCVTLVGLLLTFFMLPYQAILLLIGTFIPAAEDWIIAHGGGDGVVVCVPKGYELGNLVAIGEYYKSCSFMAAWEYQTKVDAAERATQNSYYVYEDGLKRPLTYTDSIVNDNGITVEIYKDDYGHKWIKGSDGNFTKQM